MKEHVGGAVRKIYPSSKVISITRLTKGCINRTFSVKIKNPDKDIIFRLYPKDGWKSEKEKYIYGLISKKTNVPVPKFLNIDTSKKLFPQTYALLSKIPGKELTKNNTGQIKEAGNLLAKIHSIKFNRFGWIVGKKIDPGFKKWEEFCNFDFNHKINNLKEHKKISVSKIKDIINYYKENKHVLDIKDKPCLIHKDYHFSHILNYKNKISGIIDVEWAISGHNELDLVKSIMWMFPNDKRLQNIFLGGYGIRLEDLSERKEMYEFLISVSSALFSCDLKSDRWLRYNMKKLESILR
ncbi:MAG: aminoglycoside phosphotransferase family protein [Nanoarchaeota archaeon]